MSDGVFSAVNKIFEFLDGDGLTCYWVDEAERILEYEVENADTKFVIRVTEDLENIHYVVKWFSLTAFHEPEKRLKVVEYFMSNFQPPVFAALEGDTVFLMSSVPKIERSIDDIIILFLRTNRRLRQRIDRRKSDLMEIANLLGLSFDSISTSRA